MRVWKTGKHLLVLSQAYTFAPIRRPLATSTSFRSARALNYAHLLLLHRSFTRKYDVHEFKVCRTAGRMTMKSIK